MLGARSRISRTTADRLDFPFWYADRLCAPLHLACGPQHHPHALVGGYWEFLAFGLRSSCRLFGFLRISEVPRLLCLRSTVICAPASLVWCSGQRCSPQLRFFVGASEFVHILVSQDVVDRPLVMRFRLILFRTLDAHSLCHEVRSWRRTSFC